VEDNCEAIDSILRAGEKGEVYNIAGDNERKNVEVAKLVAKNLGRGEQLIAHVKDRPGHDWRYSLNADKARALGWFPRTGFEEGLGRTVTWYEDNRWWWQEVTT